MASLASSLSQTEISEAERIGKALARSQDCEEEEGLAQAQYRDLSPEAQIYAQQKRHETEAVRSIARDLETDTPRTDYTLVKKQIASGSVKLDSIMSELPITWQDIRTITERAERPRRTEKPPKREFLYLQIMTRDRGLLKDKRAERDGKWIMSNKHEMMVPYQAPVPMYELRVEGAPPIRKGEAVVITHDPGSEWDTEFWRKDGRLDEVYKRAKEGKDPERLRSDYRWSLMNKAAGVVGGGLLVLYAILWVTW